MDSIKGANKTPVTFVLQMADKTLDCDYECTTPMALMPVCSAIPYLSLCGQLAAKDAELQTFLANIQSVVRGSTSQIPVGERVYVASILPANASTNGNAK
jgi:hypothetical protein